MEQTRCLIECILNLPSVQCLLVPEGHRLRERGVVFDLDAVADLEVVVWVQPSKDGWGVGRGRSKKRDGPAPVVQHPCYSVVSVQGQYGLVELATASRSKTTPRSRRRCPSGTNRH